VSEQPAGAPRRRRKVYAYITHGHRLLIFSHVDAPEAGTQVPGGTLEEGEDPALGVLREAEEETGLRGLRLVSLLGEREHPIPELGEVHHRYYYHLICGGTPPETWEHREMYPSDGSNPPLFRLHWVALPAGVPPLRVDLDQELPTLLRHLGFG
jgi:8-oxo-dGTP diphosphatase